VILFGLGGLFTEVLRDVALRICPIHAAQALAMIEETKGPDSEGLPGECGGRYEGAGRLSREGLETSGQKSGHRESGYESPVRLREKQRMPCGGCEDGKDLAFRQVTIKPNPPVTKEIIVIIDAFCFVRLIYPPERSRPLPCQRQPGREDWQLAADLAPACIAEISAAALFCACPVGGNGKDVIFQTSCHHSVLAERKDQIGTVTDHISSFQSQDAHGFGKNPVEADHDPHFAQADIIDLKSLISRMKQRFSSLNKCIFRYVAT